jgi:O-antigen ligase
MNSDTKKKNHPFVEWITKAIFWLICTSVILVPVIFLPFVESVFAVPKLYMFHIITALIILLWGIKGLFKSSFSIKCTPFLWALIAYALISVLNTIFTVNVWSSLFGTYGRFIGLITTINLLLWVYILITELNTKEKIHNLLWVSVLTGFAVSVYGILQHQDLWVNFLSWTQDPSERVFTTIGHSNHTAAYLGMNLMILIGLFVSVQARWKKPVLLFMGLMMFVTIMMTGSRGGVAAIIIALFIWFLIALRDKSFADRIRKLSKVILFILAVSILAVAVFRQPISKLPVIERTASTIEFIKEGNMPDRVSWWLSTVEMIKDKPIIGHGLSTYRDIYNKYRRLDYKVPDDAQDHITPQSAHMEYLNIWATQGTLGFIIYLLMIGAVFVYATKYIKHEKDKKNRQIMGALLAGVIVYLVQVLMSFGVVVTLFMFYTLIGLVISYGMIDKNYVCTKLRLNFILRMFLAILSLGVFVCVGYYSVSFLASEYHTKQANVFAARNDFEEALDNYEKAIIFMPYISDYYSGYADYLFEVGIRMPDNSQPAFLEDSLNLYQKAIDWNPNIPYVYVNKGTVASRMAVLFKDDVSKFPVYGEMAFNDYGKAVEISRNNPVYPYKYGKFLQFHELPVQAKEQFENVLKIRDPYKDTAELLNSIPESSEITEPIQPEQ